MDCIQSVIDIQSRNMPLLNPPSGCVLQLSPGTTSLMQTECGRYKVCDNLHMLTYLVAAPALYQASPQEQFRQNHISFLHPKETSELGSALIPYNGAADGSSSSSAHAFAAGASLATPRLERSHSCLKKRCTRCWALRKEVDMSNLQNSGHLIDISASRTMENLIVYNASNSGFQPKYAVDCGSYIISLLRNMLFFILLL